MFSRFYRLPASWIAFLRKAWQEKIPERSEDDFFHADPQGPALRPGGERLPLLQRNEGVFSCFPPLELSPTGEKECLPVTPLVRFAARLDFFIFFAPETVWRAHESLSDTICLPFRFTAKINVKLKFAGIWK